MAYQLFFVASLSFLLLGGIGCNPEPVKNSAANGDSTRPALPPSSREVANVTNVKPEPSQDNTTTPISTPTPISTTTPTSTTTTPITKTSPKPPTTTSSTTTSAPNPKPTPTSTTTSAPNTTPTPKHDRSFDLPSFIGGVILSLGLAAIGYVVYKFYRTRTDPNYRTL